MLRIQSQIKVLKVPNRAFPRQPELSVPVQSRLDRFSEEGVYIGHPVR
jgi:hypothetical protein